MKHPLYNITRYIKACGDNGPKLQRILDEHSGIIQRAKGSQHNHQAWEGGYLQHVVDCMSIARILLNAMPKQWPVPFEWSSVVLVLFLHDIEKPFMQARMAEDPEMPVWNKEQREMFKGEMIGKYDIKLTFEELHALHCMTFIEDKASYYQASDRRMNELGAFCHAADVLSARLWHSRNKPGI
jgi:hypothetical protein